MQLSSKVRKLALAVALTTGSVALIVSNFSPAFAFEPSSPVRVEMTVPDFSALVEKNAAAVVNITVTGKDQSTMSRRGMPIKQVTVKLPRHIRILGQ